MVLQKKTSISLVLVAVSVIVMSSTGSSFAQDFGMSITATAQDGSDTIMVTGETVHTGDVSIKVMSPNRSVIAVDQVSPDENGNFAADFKIDEDQWLQDGLYTITAKQGSASLYELSVKVQVAGGTAFETMATQSTFENTILRQNEVDKIRGLTIQVDAAVGSNMIAITGNTDKIPFPVSIKVVAPNDNVVAVDQASPDADGNFSVDIITGEEAWDQDGFYTITAHQDGGSQYKASAQVEILDGLVIPEFGTIAVLVLAVAIISIIAVSARSRLSIMPKY